MNRSSVSDRPPARQRYGYRFLSQEHIDFLTDPQTLTRWAGKSLWERCILFHRHFGSHRINPTLLRKVYQVHKIKSKKVRQVKLIKPDKELEYENWRIEIRDRIRSLRRQSRRIIYIDETVFTWKSIKLTEYSPLHHNHRVPQSKVIQPVFSLILAISEENGLEHYRIY